MVIADEILVGAGRVPNVDGLNLEGAGVAYDPPGLRSTISCRPPIRASTRRATLPVQVHPHRGRRGPHRDPERPLPGEEAHSALTIPWCTYTDPEIAHVGMYERDARERGIPVDTFVRQMKDVDRAIADGEEEGFVKVHVRKGTGKILGATIVARHAGEMINEISLAMVGGSAWAPSAASSTRTRHRPRPSSRSPTCTTGRG